MPWESYLLYQHLSVKLHTLGVRRSHGRKVQNHASHMEGTLQHEVSHKEETLQSEAKLGGGNTKLADLKATNDKECGRPGWIA